MEAFEFFPATGTFFFHSANLNRTKRFFAYFRGVFPGLARPTASPPLKKNTKKLFKFICLDYREGISRDGAAFFKGG